MEFNAPDALKLPLGLPRSCMRGSGQSRAPFRHLAECGRLSPGARFTRNLISGGFMRVSPAAVVLVFATATVLAAAPASAQSKDWEVTLTPYIWLSWPEGDIEAKSGPIGGGGANLPEINANFDDVGISGAFTGSGDFRYQRFGFFGDLTYYELEADKNINVVGDIFLDGQFEIKGTKAMAVGYWRAFEDDRNKIDLLAGVHWLKAELGIDLTTNNRALSTSIDEDWVDPLIGIRGFTKVSDNFGLEGFATYGGFGVSSDELYDLYVAASWRFNDLFTASLGYRYFTDKFEGDLLDYEISFSGPLAGFAFHF